MSSRSIAFVLDRPPDLTPSRLLLLPLAPALLAGNSVHADRAFINKDLPLLASKLHYRILDVSSIKELARRWYPKALAESRLKRKEDAEHRYARVLSFRTNGASRELTFSACSPFRALADIQASIEGKCRHYIHLNVRQLTLFAVDRVEILSRASFQTCRIKVASTLPCCEITILSYYRRRNPKRPF